MIVRFPDRRLAGTTVRQPVSLVDVMPSVLSWVGLEVPSDLDGTELPLTDHARQPSTDDPIYFEPFRTNISATSFSKVLGLISRIFSGWLPK